VKKVSISWSGGKDCTMALQEVLAAGTFEVCSLHTSFNRDTGRVGLHGVRQELIAAQCESLGFGLDKIFVSSSMDHDEYIRQTKHYYELLRAQGVDAVVFGDLFLEDLKVFREGLLGDCGLEPIFPIWQRPTKALAHAFVDNGFKAIVCAADGKYFGGAGYDYDEAFINSLPDGVDPCGEYGEFHTFVYDGPLFNTAVPVVRGETVSKQYEFKSVGADGNERMNSSTFWFRELMCLGA
jgi:uncharacterized protein (TIGR00290 family)